MQWKLVQHDEGLPAVGPAKREAGERTEPPQRLNLSSRELGEHVHEGLGRWRPR